MNLSEKHILIFHNEQTVSESFFNLLSKLLVEDAIVQVISRSAIDPLQACVSNNPENYLACELLRLIEMGAFGWSARQQISLNSLPFHWIILWDNMADIGELGSAGAGIASNGETQSTCWKGELVAACTLHRRLLSFSRADVPSDIDLEPYYSQDFTTAVETKASLSSVPAALTDYTHSFELERTPDSEETKSDSSLSDDELSCTTLTDSSLVIHELQPKRKGVLYLVGMGPGSPDLLTLRAHKLIHTCPVIISDRLVCTEIFKYLPSSTKLLFSRKVCGKANAAQDEINRWILENLNAGLDVVRAKGGDPFVFGRGGEEWNLASKAGFDVKWVPGISSSIAGAGILHFIIPSFFANS